jgi:ATP-binding cassette, subfamily B, bacterial
MRVTAVWHSPPVRALAGLAAARWNIIRLSRRAGIPLAGGLAAVNFVIGLLPVAFVIAAAIVVGRVPAAVHGGLGSAAWRSLIAAFVLAAIIFIAAQVAAPAEVALAELLARRVDGEVIDDLMTASLRSQSVAPFADQAVLDDLRAAMRELESNFESPGRACAGQFALIARYTQLCGYAVLIGVAFSWLAAAGIVTAVLLFRYGQRGGMRKYAQAKAALASGERKADYLRELAIEPAAGKEIRVFGMVDWLRRYFSETFLNALAPAWAARRRIYLWPFVRFATWGLIVAAAAFGLVGASGASRTDLTSFALAIQSFLGALRLAGHYPEADTQTAFGMLAYDAVERVVSRVGGYGAGSGTAERAVPAPEVPGRAVPGIAQHIRFEHVTFRYPGQETAVLEDLDLTIPAGKCTAIVGLNGAGKTTLVKLLARLYEPLSGAVLADDVDVRSYPVDEWRAKIAVIFQDFVRYEVSAYDNIAFGAVTATADASGISAAARQAGIADVLERLPRGLQTPLSGHLAGGMELSGGQWQRVALARALFALRHGASLVVLDEPTASLDVRAEASFFDEFAAITRDSTTLLISHRFSTVRHADLIVVLDGGRVVEQGSHDELLAKRGRYAWLFELQADRFADPVLPQGDAVLGGRS